MGQQEVYKILKRNPNKWFSSVELNKRLKSGSCGANLTRLYRSGEVNRKITGKGIQKRYSYRFKQ